MSTNRDSRQAGTEAAAGAVEALGVAPTLAVVFATAGHDQHALLGAIGAAVGPGCQVVGCSGEGVIGAGLSHECDHAVEVMAIALDGATAEAHFVDCYARDSVGAAHALAAKVGPREGVIGVLVFPDGLGGDCSAFLDALHAQLPGVVIVGGAAGDAMTFERTFQYCNATVGTGAVSAIVLRGKGSLKVDVSHGCTPVGPQQMVTQLDGVWLKRIDDRPAWDVFKAYLDGDPVDLNADGIVHLCVGTAADSSARYVTDPMIIRTPLALDAQTGALLFPGGGLREGQRIRMTRRDGDRIRQSATECARRVAGDQQAPPAFVFQFDCAGRGKVMFGACAADEIIAPLRRELGTTVPWGGFHTYGEIAQTAGRVAYHNYTVALCAFYDA